MSFNDCIMVTLIFYKHIKPFPVRKYAHKALGEKKHIKSFDGHIWQCKYRKSSDFNHIKALVVLLRHIFKHIKALSENST